MSQFKVVLQNAISEEYTQLEVEQNLARLLKISDQKIERLLSKPETTVKKGVDSDIAEKYKKLIERCGLSCEIRPMETPATASIEMDQASPEQQEKPASVYTPPQADLSPQATQPYQLYSIGGVGVATFFGSILAGGIIMWINFRRLGKFEAAQKTLIYTCFATIALFGVLMMLPDDLNIPDISFTIPQIIMMVSIAKAQQKADIDAHIRKGGKMASKWKAFGIGLLAIIPILAAIIGVTFLLY